jgi:type I restriction enzyme, R subunit
MMREQVATALAMEPDAFDAVPFNQHGGLGKAYEVFGPELNDILMQLNERLVA